MSFVYEEAHRYGCPPIEPAVLVKYLLVSLPIFHYLGGEVLTASQDNGQVTGAGEFRLVVLKVEHTCGKTISTGGTVL